MKFVCLTMYDETIDAPAIFPPEERMKNILGEYLSQLGLVQLRIAETEKYAHVTYFFNGGEEVPFPGEERISIPSPKVATYDLKPEMSAWGVTERVLEEIKSNRFDVIDELCQLRYGGAHREPAGGNQGRGDGRRLPGPGGPGHP